MVTSITSTAQPQAAQAPVKKTQAEEVAVAAPEAQEAGSDSVNTDGVETQSALSSATARVGDQLGAQAGAARVARASTSGGAESADYIAEADTNSDKKVSDQERIAYEKKLEQQAQDKSGAVQKAYGLVEDSEPSVSATA